MSFRLKNAPTIFSRVVIAAFKEFIHQFLEVYLDDWIVYSLLKHHVEVLRLMLERCRQCQISLNIKKCIFGTPFGILLGHIVCKHYLLGKHFKMFTDHSALKYLVNKPVLGGRIYRWLFIFQEFDFEVIVKPGKMNAGPDHLSRVTNGEEPTNLEDNFRDAQLFSLQIVDDYFTKIIQYFSTGSMPQEYTTE
jgi:hypothetical protein